MYHNQKKWKKTTFLIKYIKITKQVKINIMTTVRLHMAHLQPTQLPQGGRGTGLGTCNRITKNIIIM